MYFQDFFPSKKAQGRGTLKKTKSRISLLPLFLLSASLFLSSCGVSDSALAPLAHGEPEAVKEEEKAAGETEDAGGTEIAGETKAPGEPAESPAEKTQDDILAGMDDSEKNWMDLTPDQYLKDFDGLYQELLDNYPYFHVALRKKGIDIQENYSVFRKRVEGCKNDVDYFAALREFVETLDFTGHISAWGYRYMSELANLQNFVEEFPEYRDTLAPYIEKLNNPISQKNYRAMEPFYNGIDRLVEEENAALAREQKATGTGNLAESGAENTAENGPEEVAGSGFSNIETKIIKEDEIAYVGISSFDMNCYNDDQKALLPFYESIADYDHLIVDITKNGGGGMEYFNDLVVAPLTDRTLTVPTYLLIKGGENNLHFLQVEKGLEEGTWKPIGELPSLPDMNPKDLEEMDYFMEETYTVNPADPRPGFHGKIWMLVSPLNYSSSEYAAMFSKHSGFATLVGSNTGGDGIGVDPAYIILKKSGIVVQYSPVYGVTADGKNSEEFGTAPDIAAPQGVTALEACLKAIEESED